MGFSRQNISQKKLGGFTLIEVITAVFVIVVGIGGVVALINQTIRFSQNVPSKLIASYLAQEGIEIVKNIRDSNFLKTHKTGSGNWDDNLIEAACLSGGRYEYEGDYTSTSSLSCYTSTTLKIDGGFYKYSSTSSETIFIRKIIITPGSDILEVLVEVTWQERGRTHKVTAKENLYQWW